MVKWCTRNEHTYRECIKRVDAPGMSILTVSVSSVLMHQEWAYLPWVYQACWCTRIEHTYRECIKHVDVPGMSQTWGESTFNDSESESDSGRLFDSESESDSSQFGYDSESDSDSSNISIQRFRLRIRFQFQFPATDMKLLLGNFATRIGSSKIITARNCDHAFKWHKTLLFCCYMPIFNIHDYIHT